MASSSCHVTEIKHDVFISFRGADVRRGLLSHLVKELRRAKIDAYVDDRLERGDEISSSLVTAIEGSQLLLVIFSKDYASSKWCLEELVKMVDCMERNKQIVIPIFYNVDPSDVRHQKGEYGAAMAKHEKSFKEDMAKIQTWRSALEKAAQLSGIHYPSTFENESHLIDEIVKDVSNKLSKLFSSESDDPSESNAFVGIDQNIAWIKSLLTTESREVLKLGIWGMGGIGKTTIARVVFDTFSPKYDGCCFLENVREELEKHQLSYLQEKLVSKLLEEEYRHINSTSKANYFTKRVLSRKKVLIVLDDVNTPILLKDFLEPICLSPGSTLIVTSRDKNVLTAGGFREMCLVKELNFQESLKLFSMNAFNESQPKKGYEDLSKQAVAIAKGIPLALIVFGSYFHSKTKDAWECALEKLKKYADRNIHRVLKLSYDGLDDLEKKVFLDIAFFFKEEDKDYVIRQLDAWRFHGACGIEALQEKALITISDDNRIRMHDLIQEMGWEIVRQESEDPGRRSRLGDPEEVYDVLKNNKGTDIVEGLLLDVSHIGEVAFIADSLKRMPKLRLLKFCSPMPVEVPMQIRYFLPEDFVNVNLKKIAADDVLEKKGEMFHEECDRFGRRSHPWNINYVEHRMPIEQDFGNVKRSGIVIPKQFSMLRKLHELPGTYQLQNCSGCDGVLILETNFMGGSNQHLMPIQNPNIGSAIEELMDLGGEVHTKFLHYLFMDGCSVSKESSVFPEEMRQPNLTNTGMELLNSSTGNFISLECSDYYNDGLTLLESTLPTQLPYLRSTYYHRLSSSNRRGQDSAGRTNNKLVVLFDGFRYSARVTFLSLGESLPNLLPRGCRPNLLLYARLCTVAVSSALAALHSGCPRSNIIVMLRVAQGAAANLERLCLEAMKREREERS